MRLRTALAAALTSPAGFAWCSALGLSFGTLALGTACSPAADPVTVELQVGGMVCESCSEAITAAVTRLDGVLACEVDHATGRAVVRHDPARTDRAAIAAAITRLGYTVTP